MDGGVAPVPPRRCHVLIVGGGASGVLMAAHLLKQPGTNFDVTIVERGDLLGCGIAYATDDPDHLLNTRVVQMSAYPDDPEHFLRWLDTRGIEAEGSSFVGRGTYGRYLASLLDPWRDSDAPGHGRLHHVRAECLRVEEIPAGVEALLQDGRVIHADRAILATGHAVPVRPDPPLCGGWDFRPPADPRATVVIIGTGLSMVDHVATLLSAGHLGPIHCLSRRGLLPQEHAASHPITLTERDIPFGASVSQVMRWLRALVRVAETQGGTWRDAVDGMRPHVAGLWQAWTVEERARFLRHAAVWWEAHRHRMPPISTGRLSRAAAQGQLHFRRATFEQADLRPDGRIELRLTGRPGSAPDRLEADHVIDCRGIRRNTMEHVTCVLRNLLEQGAARLDLLRLGLDTSPGCHLLSLDGSMSVKLYAIGPAARGAFWEITAIPDIRQQTADLARALGETVGATTGPRG
ncbi:FAD/NAD(P)-binding protein [Yangia mangrovi]|uniref:FAD-dependent oxidoreductase n=2 Tax=Alloyangia mangrovi TaxID=1779329 RepID=A0A2A3K2N2_9RHOB|nr:FAD/NAD(P)-binding protein [Alloyangia mangrovi]